MGIGLCGSGRFEGTGTDWTMMRVGGWSLLGKVSLGLFWLGQALQALQAA